VQQLPVTYLHLHVGWSDNTFDSIHVYNVMYIYRADAIEVLK